MNRSANLSTIPAPAAALFPRPLPLATLLLGAVLLGAFLLATATPAAAGDGKVTVATTVHLLVGFPSAEAGEAPGTLFAPGTVLPLGDSSASAKGAEGSSAGEVESFFDLAESLRRTVRLESVDARYKLVRPFALGEPNTLPSPSSSSRVSISATLVGANDELASYQIRISEGDEVLADSRVAIKRGGRAVVGGLDGEAAPYLFLVLEPLTPDEAGQVSWLSEDFTPPRALTRPQPQYTPDAKELRIQGLVILQAIIGTDGRVGEVNVLKGLPSGLTEAAIEAVRQWIFEPALDADGQPVAVYYNLTLNFRLD